MLRCHIWVLLGVKRLFSLSFSLFCPAASPFLGHFKLAHQFWFSYPPPGAGGGSSSELHVRHWVLQYHFLWSLIFFRPPFLLFPFDVFGSGLISFAIFFRIRFSFSFLFLYFVFFTCLSVVSLSDTLRSFVCFLSKRQVSKCTQSLALFYSSIKYISLRFLYTYISYVHVTEWTRISYIPRCKLINALYIYRIYYIC